MRVRLKGLNSKRKSRKDGTVVSYFYAWKGGPRLSGEPGSPEFLASYYEAVSAKRTPPAGTLMSILIGYQASDEFLHGISNRTRADYVRIIKVIEREYGDFPLAALTDKRSVGEFKSWRDRLARKSRRQADYHWTVLALILKWALGRGLVAANPCEKGGRLYRDSRVEKVWTEDDEAAFLRGAPAHLHLALELALWTGQRQGDLLRLTWAAYDGSHFRLKQSKTSRRVVIPVGAPLKAMLDATPRKSTAILVNTNGKPWTEDGFRSSWRKAQTACGIVGVTFNDLRGTAVTRLARCECTEAEIATITGHSLRDVHSILDAHYLNRDPSLGESAIRKLESRTKIPDRAPDRA